MGSRGDSCDNALAESVNGLYKAELVHRRGPWRGLEDLELATLEWVGWFNHRRLSEPCRWGAVSPSRGPNVSNRTCGVGGRSVLGWLNQQKAKPLERVRSYVIEIDYFLRTFARLWLMVAGWLFGSVGARRL